MKFAQLSNQSEFTTGWDVNREHIAAQTPEYQSTLFEAGEPPHAHPHSDSWESPV